MVQSTESYLNSSVWTLNNNISGQDILHSTWYDIKSVFTEELIFRGALLFILIQKIGSKKSILISAIAFGVYHWFSYGILGNVMAMIFIFIGTGLMGYALAWAFAKSRSILLPFGLHLGWNLIHNTIFSKGPLGDMVLIQIGGTQLTDWTWILNYLSGMILVPVVVMIYIHYFVKNETEINTSL